MFWNKNKIPNYTFSSDSYADEDDLFYYEDESPEVYKVTNNGVNSFYTDLNYSHEDEETVEINDSDDYYENEEKKEKLNRRLNIFNKIASIFLAVVIILGLLVTIDVICVSRFNVGPFFAIRTKKINDGGTKVYHGLGYKVIKYRQSNGRNDLVLGGWKLKYSTSAIDVWMVDLAIDFNSSNGDKYLNKFIRVTGNVFEVNNDEIVLIYLDDDGKYTTKLSCSMASDAKINDVSVDKNVTLVGSLKDYSNSNIKTLNMKNCYLK